MAQIQNIQDLNYNKIDLCILDMGESSHLINECNGCRKDSNCCHPLEYIGFPKKLVSDYCSSYELICCMITREGQSEADIRYIDEKCPKYVKQIMKLELFNCYSIVLTDLYKGSGGTFQSLCEISFISDIIPDLLPRNEDVWILDKKIYTIKLEEEQEYRVLYIKIEDETII